MVASYDARGTGLSDPVSLVDLPTFEAAPTTCTRWSRLRVSRRSRCSRTDVRLDATTTSKAYRPHGGSSPSPGEPPDVGLVRRIEQVACNACAQYGRGTVASKSSRSTRPSVTASG